MDVRGEIVESACENDGEVEQSVYHSIDEFERSNSNEYASPLQNVESYLKGFTNLSKTLLVMNHYVIVDRNLFIMEDDGEAAIDPGASSDQHYLSRYDSEDHHACMVYIGYRIPGHRRRNYQRRRHHHHQKMNLVIHLTMISANQ
ncbi:hypothetical protein CEXT_455861 [Caerostris extrusa]|uniref:Uncharacterized protein n=1 Tax=Caerostris extrusa TaxID=172846 RepID=A0AAV4Q0Z1_CAEEX|nr:hypothetical protein CEXT_455861 [Caerostris extrusa]